MSKTQGVVAETLHQIVAATPERRWTITRSAQGIRGTRRTVRTQGKGAATSLLIQRGIDQATVSALKLMMIIPMYAEEKNARGNFEHIAYSIKLFKELGWSFRDFFIGFEEMVMTVRQKLLESTPLIHDSTVVAIKKVVIAKSREGRIAANVLEIKNSYRRARQFITFFSLQIFELFQAFHKCNENSLPLCIAQLWP